MGGRVALEIYRIAAPRVERLALLDTGSEGVASGEAERRAPLVERALAEGIEAIARVWALPMLAATARRDGPLVDAILAMVGRKSGQVYAGQTRALLARPDATALLGSIACPTLVLCGQQDGWSPPERHRAMAELIPHSLLRLIGDCGHMSTMEQPQAVLRALEEWLAQPAGQFEQPVTG
jgi:pimeloyl-ACP methyl ester carboxylesterase